MEREGSAKAMFGCSVLQSASGRKFGSYHRWRRNAPKIRKVAFDAETTRQSLVKGERLMRSVVTAADGLR